MPTGLISVREPYADRILDGTKRFEFRTRTPRIEGSTTFLVYVPSPRRELAGEMVVSNVVEGPPEKVWERFADAGGIDADDYFDYFEGRDRAVALEIEEADRFPFPLGLAGIRRHVREDFRPPQYLHWLTPDAYRRFKRVVEE